MQHGASGSPRPVLINESFDVLGSDPRSLGPVLTKASEGRETLQPDLAPEGIPNQLGLGLARGLSERLDFVGEIVRERY
jgi:hypothetical protein